jgi:uncharacterized protein (TIRG00374 family)
LKTKLGKIALYTVPLLIGMLLIWYSISILSEDEKSAIKNSFKSANYFWVGFALLLGVLSNLSRAYRFKFLLEPLGYKPKFLNSTMAIFTSYLINLLIPRSGEVVRATMHKKYDGIALDKVLGVVVAERISDVFMLLLFIAIAFGLQAPLIEDILFKDSTKVGIVIKVILIITIPFLFFKIYQLLEKSKNANIQRVIKFIQGLVSGVLSIVKMKKKWSFLLHTLFIWTLYLLMFYVGTFAIKEINNLSIDAVVVGFVVGALSMTVSNGGLGWYPVLVSGALIQFEVEKNAALSFSWIIWTSQTVLVIIGGCISFVLIPIYNDWLNRKKKRIIDTKQSI